MSDENFSSSEPRNDQVQEQEAQRSFVFLNFTKLDEHKDINNRKIIRSGARHSRRQNRPRRKMAPMAMSPVSSSGRSDSKAQAYGVPHRMPLGGDFEMLYSEYHSLLLESSLHTRNINPPDSLPPAAPKYAPTFLNYFAILLTPHIQKETPETPQNLLRTALVPVALSQELFFEAVMYMVSTHLDVLRGTSSSRTTLFHRGKSLSLINEHLQKQTTNPSDVVIATAFGLVNYDNVNGLLTDSTTQIAGVRKMVMLRGGLQHLGMNGVLAKMISLCDVMGAALGTSKPMFQPSKLVVGNSSQDILGLLPIRTTFYEQHSTFSTARGVDEKIISLLSVVRMFNMQLSLIQNKNWTEERASAFLNAGSQLRRRLFSLATTGTDQDHLHPKYHQYECCRLAAQIYVESIFSPLSFSTPVNYYYVRELAVALQKVDSPSDWNPIPEALVWICLVGGAAAKEQPERRWMVAHLGPTMLSLGMLYFEDLMRSLIFFMQLSGLYSKYWNATSVNRSNT